MTETLDIDVTPEAQRLLREAASAETQAPMAVRIRAVKVGLRRFHYAMDLVPAGDQRPEDRSRSIADGALVLLADEQSAEYLRGATIDFVDLGGLQGAGFRFENPQEQVTWNDPLAQRLHALFEDEINPSLASHGGFVELERVEDGVAYVHMGGGCQGCGQAAATLQEGVEAMVRARLPEIERLVDVTNHAAGTRPYYP